MPCISWRLTAELHLANMIILLGLSLLRFYYLVINPCPNHTDLGSSPTLLVGRAHTPQT